MAIFDPIYGAGYIRPLPCYRTRHSEQLAREAAGGLYGSRVLRDGRRPLGTQVVRDGRGRTVPWVLRDGGVPRDVPW